MSRTLEGLNLGSLELFCLTAEHESFSGAAAAAGLTPPAASRTIARLEERLGVRLFARTTRQVKLTEQGRAFYAQCRQALTQLAEAERMLNGTQTAASGTVRISLPTSYGHYRILPLLGEFRRLYPGVTLDVQLSNRSIDFIADGFDLSIRARPQPDSGLVVRPIEEAVLVIVAAPEYLAQRGTPRVPDDLENHELIEFVLPMSGQLVPWVFMHEGETRERLFAGPLRCTEDIIAPVTLARHGAGIAQTYRFMVEEDLRSGRLVELLPEYAGAWRPFSLVYPANRHMPQRVRVLVDFLIERLTRRNPRT